MSGLYDEFKMKNLKLKNRIVLPPMCTNMANNGFINDWHFVHYSTRAIGGVGLIIVEATAVSEEGRITKDDLGLWDDEQIKGLKKIVEFSHSEGASVALQLAHAGRKSDLGSLENRPLAPSEIGFSSDYILPRKMSKEDISEIVENFKRAAKRALEANFDAIEIHGAHGYLINQFLSPLSNTRTDKYGGILKNRLRILVEIVRAIKEVWPSDRALMLRISADEYDELGNNLDDFVEIVSTAKSEGVDIVDISTGGVVPKKIMTYPGYQISHAEYIKQNSEISVIAGGLVTSVLMADEIVRNRRADLVYMGRELLRNPYMPLTHSKKVFAEIKWPTPYERSKVVRKFGF
ncbi:NADPH dehydrogenase NamA [Helicovermis profundi]|uniref:NADPH dehydrogenase NamA n=2 Tax=Helicovermis profundi TaxID=3065157 RepID=A0AAU9EGK9_9FIRM|nr:NADPH dehydrogenase NamA [Clostridia bacterium S502]